MSGVLCVFSITYISCNVSSSALTELTATTNLDLSGLSLSHSVFCVMPCYSTPKIQVGNGLEWLYASAFPFDAMCSGTSAKF